jgi:hypothetical protein
LAFRVRKQPASEKQEPLMNRMMTRRISFVITVTGIALLLLILYNRKPVSTRPVSIIRSEKLVGPRTYQKNPLNLALSTNIRLDTTHPDKPSLLEILFTRIEAGDLKTYEGSYTWDELKTKQDNPQSYSLRSKWLFHDSNVPQATAIIQEDPETGSYELRGGALFFPTPGIGLRHEETDSSGETRSAVYLKKEF